ncbi:LysM peptidoglycan-binding domain-containing protein [Rhizobium sp. RAF56]|uniref:LysM peptidoglycan-binding domain-containing protein n=1 Tax=Rhizobium sp. RAF56 TaxID=3233062 RepID=UPI003F9B2442
MMKNRASLLALFVLVVATILMIFFVLPRIGKDEKPIGDAANQASSEVKNANADNAAKPTDATQQASDTTQKLGSLTTAAAASISELKALFADGKGPAADVFAAAKAKVVDALQAIVDFAPPAGADPAAAMLADKARDGAGKALVVIRSLPENIPDALAATEQAAALLSGKAPAVQQADAGPVRPAFDVLRVEPDGSTVIAGSAEPGSKLQIMDGDTVVTTVEVGPTGDFAAVLDNPLAAGDHELVLKSIGKDGNAVASEEVATVSVPKNDKSQLLAMVSKPGKASRIITAPTAKQSRVANGEPSPQATDAGAAEAPADGATVAAAEPAKMLPAATPSAPEATGGQAAVVVNAVEIENDHIFVAGTARPNAKVRAYADEKLIGEITAGGDGHFVVDGVMPLAVGDHKIRVDIVDTAGNVTVRTSVDFNRPEGNQVTVAAQPGATPGAASPAALVPLEEGELGKLKADTGKAFGLLKGLFAEGKVPGPEELAAARSATEIALKALGEFRPAIDATTDLKTASANASTAAAKALAVLQALPKDAKSVGDALINLDQMIAAVTKPVAKAPDAQTSVEAASNGGEPKTFQQAPLAESPGAVIIRHGDTLWQISRRIYGQGVRYTTIYLANQEKISNPDRILPGQVFGLPKDALPNAEELHRKRPWKKSL